MGADDSFITILYRILLSAYWWHVYRFKKNLVLTGIADINSYRKYVYKATRGVNSINEL